MSSGVPSAIRSPASSTTIRSENRITARMMCSIMMMVMPCSLNRKRMARMSSTSVVDSPAMASSEMRSFGRAARARASSSLRISICVSPAGRWCAFASSPMARRISPASAAAPAERPCAAYSSGMWRFSSTVMLVNGLGIWKLRTMPSRVRRCGGRAPMSAPSKRIRPPSAARAPEMQLMRVVFPEPFGPMRPKRSPGFTSREMLLRAVKPPKRLTTPFTSSSGVATASASPEPPHEAEDSLGRSHHEGDQDDTHDEEVHLGGDGHGGQLLGAPQEHGTDHRPDPARRAADHGHGESVHRVVEAEGGVGLDERDVVGKRRSGHAQQEAAHGRREELQAKRGNAHALGCLLVVAESGESAADAGTLDQSGRGHRDHGRQDHHGAEESHVVAKRPAAAAAVAGAG